MTKRAFAALCIFFLAFHTVIVARAQAVSEDVLHKPYLVDNPVESRSISCENRAGEKGAGGKTSSNLGVGRKGSPAVNIEAGQTFELCNIEGPGVIQHIC